MSISKKEFLREKFNNFKNFIQSKTPIDLEITDDVKNFQSMTEEELIHFAITYLIPYQNNIDYPTKIICEMFKMDFKDKSISLMVANYLELFIHIITK
jgi:hypothetical protein